MILAFGRMRCRKPISGKLFGILSVKRGFVGRFPMAARIFDVLLAIGPPVLGTQIARGLGKYRRVIGPVAANGGGDLPQVRQFRRAFDLRECDARICSISVEPERCRPTMKIGSGGVETLALVGTQEFGAEDVSMIAAWRFSITRIVRDQRPLLLVAALVPLPGRIVVAASSYAPCRARNRNARRRRCQRAACFRPAAACRDSSGSVKRKVLRLARLQ